MLIRPDSKSDEVFIAVDGHDFEEESVGVALALAAEELGDAKSYLIGRRSREWRRDGDKFEPITRVQVVARR